MSPIWQDRLMGLAACLVLALIFGFAIHGAIVNWR